MKNDKVVNKGFKLAVNKPILVVYLVFLYIRLYWGMQGRDTNLLWRYASRFYTDLGVRQYQKVENSCVRAIGRGHKCTVYYSKFSPKSIF